MKLFVCFFVVIIAVTVQALTNEQRKEDIWKLSRKCHGQAPIENSWMEDALDRKVYSTTARFRAHCKCGAQLIGFQNKQGQIQYDFIKERLKSQMTDEAEVDAVMQRCAVQKKNPVDTAFYGLTCFYDNLPDDVTIWIEA